MNTIKDGFLTLFSLMAACVSILISIGYFVIMGSIALGFAYIGFIFVSFILKGLISLF